ncbi:hypothetical protein LBWT_Y0100 (plasmid) [Leptolyngbya boryana IAM M-101]|nr:hypothetical protein LBWT_Y0100 [Leptolyngbya boryana IAM M-101]BAS66770.1 hypothetical protein LBDG_Y0100 [Leptolyngbya boryana dg5]
MPLNHGCCAQLSTDPLVSGKDFTALSHFPSEIRLPLERPSNQRK